MKRTSKRSNQTGGAPASKSAASRSVSRRDAMLIGGGIIAAPFVLRGTAFAQDARKIRFAHSAPTAHAWHRWAEHFKKAMEEKSGGSVVVEIFPDAQLGNERDIATAIRLGQIDMGAVGVGLMNWVPQMSVTDGPFLWKSRQQAYNAFEGEFGDTLRQLSLDKGFMLAGWTELGFRCMTNNVRTIKSASDMEGLKMRVPNSRAYIAMMQAMGATTVAVDLSELYLALRQGVADGQDTPPTVVKSNKLYEVQKFVSKTDHVLTTAYVVANPGKFEGLSADEQAAFNASAQEADEVLRKFAQNNEAAAYDFLGEQGMEVTLEVDGNSFRAATASVLADNPDLFPPDLVKLAQSTPA